MAPGAPTSAMLSPIGALPTWFTAEGKSSQPGQKLLTGNSLGDDHREQEKLLSSSRSFLLDSRLD